MTDKGTLYIVATPIGNLKDITGRALEALAGADLIACEDTRRSLVLLRHYKITKPLISYFEYNKLKRTQVILRNLKEGRRVALISDAGTPGISDPGYGLIRAALDAGFTVETIPGVTALITALIASGLPAHRFAFEGFLPVKAGARKKVLKKLRDEQRTAVMYESPHRLCACLADIKEVFGSRRRIAVARELTKKFEEIRRECVEEAEAHFREHPPKGEFVIVV